MANEKAEMDLSLLQASLETKYLCRKVVYKDITESTMDDAKKLAVEEGYPHGTAVIAECQTKGRGSKQHQWHSAYTGNIYLSFILYLPQPEVTLQDNFLLEVIACLSVVQAAHNLGVTSAKCKWPNDVWVRGHKLAGFLSESGNQRKRTSGETDQSLVILGIGINVNADTRCNSALAPIATSLRCELGGAFVSRAKFLADVCALLEERLEWSAKTCFEQFTADNIFLPTMPVNVYDHKANRNFEATLRTFEEDWDVTLTALPEHMAECKEVTLKCSQEQFSMRPCCSETVLVCTSAGGGEEEASDSQLVIQCLSALLDTSEVMVKPVQWTDFTSSGTDPSKWKEGAALLVLGDEPTGSEQTAAGTAILQLLKIGLPVLATAGSVKFLCSLLDIPLRTKLQVEELSRQSFVVPLKDHINSTTFTCLAGSRPWCFSPGFSFRVLAEVVCTGQEQAEQEPCTSVAILHPPGLANVGLLGIDIGKRFSVAVEANPTEANTDIFKQDALILSMLKVLVHGIN